jgi:hypothetical protein
MEMETSWANETKKKKMKVCGPKMAVVLFFRKMMKYF